MLGRLQLGKPCVFAVCLNNCIVPGDTLHLLTVHTFLHTHHQSNNCGQQSFNKTSLFFVNLVVLEMSKLFLMMLISHLCMYMG